MSIVDGVNVVSGMAESNTPFLDKLNVLSLLKKTPDAGAGPAAAAPAAPAAPPPRRPRWTGGRRRRPWWRR